MTKPAFVESDGFFTELVSSEDLTEDELHLTRWLVFQILSGAKMRQPLMVEADLARLLDAELPTLGNTPWDLRLSDGRLVEVKSFGAAGPVNVNQASKIVWIFVDKNPSAVLSEAQYYCMTSAKMSDAFAAKKTSSIRKFRQVAGAPVDASELTKAVFLP